MKIEIIAELAQGFEGKPEQARLLLKAAAAAGADAVKYQLVYADELATEDYKYYGLFQSLEMADEIWIGLAAYAKELGIRLYVDVFGVRSLRLAEQLGIEVVKLHGTDIANAGFLELIARSSIPTVLLGAGGAHAAELDRAIKALSGKNVVVLLGFQGYPTPNETNQIARVRQLVEKCKQAYSPKVVVGFADHAPPENPLRYALAATALGAGAVVLEKHLTLGQVMKLEDHESALNPDEFAEFCRVLRGCADAYGSSAVAEDFGMSESEQNYRKTIRRHVVAARDLPSGTRLVPADLVLKRAAGDQLLTNLDEVYGKTLRKSIKKNAPIVSADVG